MFLESGCIRSNWLYSDNSGCIRTKAGVFGQKWLFSGKVVVFGIKWLYLGKSGCIRVKVVVFGQRWLYSGKVVYSGKNGCIQAKWLYSG